MIKTDQELIQQSEARAQAEISSNGREAPDDFLLSESPTDLGNARCLLGLYPERFLYCPAFGTPGWLHYNGRFWDTDLAEAAVNQAMTETLKQRVLRAVECGVDDNGKFTHDKLIKACVTNDYRYRGAINRLRHEVAAEIASFDRDPDLLNCKNGVVNLRTGELTAHQAEQRFTYALPVDYKPEADYAGWISWLREVTDSAELVQYLKQAIGYSLTGHTSEECLFYLFGPARAGKGTFTETLLKLLGQPLSESVDFATFTAKREHDAQNFDLAGLKATRLIVASESNKFEILNPRRIKSVTGGDGIRCAHKHGKFFTYFPKFTIWLLSNNPVKADAEDDAIWARINVIHFPNSYVGREDKSLKRKMLKQANLEGVLRWAVEGAQAWYASLPAGLDRPETVSVNTQQHRLTNDFSSQFLDECTEQADGAFLPNAIWTKVYLAWCEQRGMTPKIAKVREALNKEYLFDRAYVSGDELRKNGYDVVVAEDKRWTGVLGENGKPIQQRGFYGVRIPADVVVEFS